MEKGKLEKRSDEICSYCKRAISEKTLPANGDKDKSYKGIAFLNGNMYHSKCFRELNGHQEFRERNIIRNDKINKIGAMKKLENLGFGGEDNNENY